MSRKFGPQNYNMHGHTLLIFIRRVAKEEVEEKGLSLIRLYSLIAIAGFYGVQKSVVVIF